MTQGTGGTGEGVFAFAPIGYVRSPFMQKKDAPRQPAAARGVEGFIELLPRSGFLDAASDLERWDHLWVVFVFDRAEGFRPRVLPPRSAGQRRGVLATRSPHRPNPIGLSVVRLLGREGLVLRVADVDMLDGTPVLDVKPYVAYTDAVPSAGSGWLEGAADPVPSFTVAFSFDAQQSLAWLRREHGIDLEEPLTRALALGPQPHAYRRIRRDGPGYRVALKEWRAWFRVEGATIEVVAIGSGYRPSQLFEGGASTGEGDPLDAHRAFVARFGASAAPW